MRLIIALITIFSLPLGASAATREDDATITVSAAANLRLAFDEIGTAFEEETGIRVDVNVGSTSQLAQQIEAGAPVDVFAPADTASINRLAEQDLIIEDTVSPYGRGQIVLWSGPDSGLAITSIDQLAGDEIQRIAIANPDHAPYGAAAKEALQSAGIWDAVQDKLVIGENISDTLRYGETGNVDVAIVALSLAIPSDGVWTIIPQELYTAIDQSIAVVAGTPHEDEARAFIAFVNGPRGREIMRAYGFLLPGEDLATPAATPDASPAS